MRICSLNKSRRAPCGNLLPFHDPLARLIKISVKKGQFAMKKQKTKKQTRSLRD